MAVPNDAPCIPHGVSMSIGPNGTCHLSPALRDLLLRNRDGYNWPTGTGAALSQRTIMSLEAFVDRGTAALNSASAHQIVVEVSRWAGNNAKSHRRLMAAWPAERAVMAKAIGDLISLEKARAGLDALCSLPGLSLVIASKIFRFSCPQIGASVDRHASYFFNSLRLTDGGFATHFVRQWSNQQHSSSRLDIYTAGGYERNKDEYLHSYLPLLKHVARALNSLDGEYCCAATGLMRTWRPADVEMAAYYWWACHGEK